MSRSISRRTFLALASLMPATALQECKKRQDGPKPPKNDGGGADTGGVPAGAPQPEKNPPPPDSRLGTVAITAYVEDAYGPYLVDMRAEDHDTGQVEHPDPNMPDNKMKDLKGKFTYDLVYPRGHRTSVTVKLAAARPGSKLGYVAIVSSSGRKVVPLHGGSVAVAELGIKG